MANSMLQEKAAQLAQQRSRCGAGERRWLRCYELAEQETNPAAEIALAQAASLLTGMDSEWYAASRDRIASWVSPNALANLTSELELDLVRVSKRLAAYAGSFRAAPAAQDLSARRTTSGKLRVGVDIRPLAIPSTRKRGIGRYVIATVSRLLRLGSMHDFVLLAEPGIAPDEELYREFASPNASFRAMGAGCDVDLDVFLLTDPSPMLAGRRTAALPIVRCPWISIIYDFIPLEFPDLYLRGNLQLVDEYLENIETVAARCERVFPISNYVGIQCTNYLDLPAERVTPIFGGVDNFFFDVAAADQSGQRSAPYFLYVGGADARKNVPRLIDAFAHATRQLPADTQLLFVGEMNDVKTRDTLNALGANFLADRVIGLGSRSDEELRALYANALATVFVSLSEGLGLPALEAMAAGCPVISSNTSALGETVGDVGLLVNPNSTEEISAAMLRMSCDMSLRESLSRRGVAHARGWTWDDVANKILAELPKHAVRLSARRRTSRKLRVAMINRANVWDAQGGDTRVMLQMQRAAQMSDIEVFFPETDEQTVAADIIHVVNMTLPRLMQHALTLAEQSGKPLVVTTLFEDWPRYLNASHEAFAVYRACRAGRLPRAELQAVLSRIGRGAVAPQAAQHDVRGVARFLACSASEAARLAEAFPASADRIRVVPFEVEAPLAAEDKTLASLRGALGLEEYILCIGRLETRKNQLALQAALEHDDIAIVYAAGGYSPQPEYANTVKAWPRRGVTKTLDRMPWHLMSALIRGAAAHALPSFYELPGLVHLECAAAGVPIVAADWGALPDYLPAEAFHVCDPLDLDSIRVAVSDAMSNTPSPAIAESAAAFSSERLADRLQTVYDEVMNEFNNTGKRDQRAARALKSPFVPGGTYAAV